MTSRSAQQTQRRERAFGLAVSSTIALTVAALLVASAFIAPPRPPHPFGPQLQVAAGSHTYITQWTPSPASLRPLPPKPRFAPRQPLTASNERTISSSLAALPADIAGRARHQHASRLESPASPDRLRAFWSKASRTRGQPAA